MQALENKEENVTQESIVNVEHEDTDALVVGYIPDILDDNAPAQVVYDPNYAIVMSNAMIKGRLAMNIRESKIFRLLVSQVQPDDTEFKVFQISINTLAKILCIGSVQSLRRDIRQIVANLLSQQVWIHSNNNANNWKAFSLLQVCESDGTYVRFQLSDQLKPYLTQLTGEYTQYPTYLLGGFTSTYALRIYELLQMVYTRNYRKRYQFRVDIDELRFILRADTSNKAFYPSVANFKARVLDSAVEQINANLLTEFSVDYTLDKDGTRKVRYVIFKIKPREYWNNPQEAPAEVRAAAQAALELQKQIRAANTGNVRISSTNPNDTVLIADAEELHNGGMEAMDALLAQNDITQKTLAMTAQMAEKTSNIKEEIPDMLKSGTTKRKKKTNKNKDSKAKQTENASEIQVQQTEQGETSDCTIYTEEDPYDEKLQQLSLLP